MTDATAAWRATYRLQLTADFGFAEAEALVPYLRDLGVSHLYLSPSLEAVRGSTHGYDGTDPTRVSEERGGEAALRSLAATAGAAGLGILLDIVPNHLAADDESPWWADEAERGRVFDIDPDTGWYRRFFDIDGLAGVRQEDPEVFERTHAKVLELVADGVVHGLRIDHPDGLTDPADYLEHLHERAGVPIWVEKILHPGEALRPWPVAGTVGYEFAVDATALFVDPDGERAVTEAYVRLTGDDEDFGAVARSAKREQLEGPFRRELDRLVELAPDIGRDALADTIVGFPIYRTYVRPAGGLVTDEDRTAVAASGAPPELAARLLLDERGHDELVTRFQQTTPPVTAKGVEDTAFYRWTRLLCLNEVGSDPERFGLSVDAFHAACLDRAARSPLGLLAATTHDTKRSADSRARIGALASHADDFALHVGRWFQVTEHLVGAHGPTPAERWFLFQTLLGSWPITSDRLDEFLVKAMREAKRETTWAEPDEAHEAAVLRYAADVLALPAFVADFVPFAEQVAEAGEWASVAQTLLRATTPGVCDVYQGDETWFLSVVDPDNRRSFDWERRRQQLAQVREGAQPTRATAKLHVLHHALALRARRPGPFAGPYVPLDAGRATVAFTRGEPGDAVLVVVPVRPDPSARLVVPPGAWVDVLHGPERDLPSEVSVAELVGPLGVGLWERRA
ncbi:MAG: treY [Acidimicrobiales bacterium]|nr:treY [Acidimicrobiales bacterium]